MMLVSLLVSGDACVKITTQDLLVKMTFVIEIVLMFTKVYHTNKQLTNGLLSGVILTVIVRVDGPGQEMINHYS
jgi:hypothetical protein